MTITGNILEFSLPEIFIFLEHHRGTGLLSIHSSSDPGAQERKSYYLWLQEGCIVAVADRLDNQGLTSLISQRGWLKPEEIFQIVNRCSNSVNTPLGVSLKNQGGLSAEQLRLLFYVQVLLRVCALFKLKDGQFVFDSTAALPWEEMTGLSLSMVDVTLVGLRVLRDWTSLAAKLPAPNAILAKAVSDQPYLKLDSQEWQVWELVNGKLSINAIAIHLKISLETVQQIACRLNMVGLVQEIPIIFPTTIIPTNVLKQIPSGWQAVTKSFFIQGLTRLLWNRSGATSPKVPLLQSQS